LLVRLRAYYFGRHAKQDYKRYWSHLHPLKN